jgi:hypothetical protein
MEVLQIGNPSIPNYAIGGIIATKFDGDSILTVAIISLIAFGVYTHFSNKQYEQNYTYTR